MPIKPWNWSEGTDEAFGSAAAYALRAEIREDGGNLEGASQDLSQAETYHRQAMGTSSAEDARRHAAMLRSLLHYDASILKVLKKPEEANTKLEEANRL